MLKDAIIDAGYHQGSFAKAVGIERPVLNLMCNGKILPTRETAVVICDLLKKPLHELFDASQAYLPDVGMKYAENACKQLDKQTQCQRVIAYMVEHGSITSDEAETAFGCKRLASRIADLRHEHGMNIVTTRVDAVNRYGERVHYGRYTFGKEAGECEDSATANDTL